MASIIIVSGMRKGDFCRLNQRTIEIGRDESLAMQILDNKVSRRHVRIHFNANNFSYSAIDIGSKNGILVNSVKIDKEIVLEDNDYISIGNTVLMFTAKDFFDRNSVLEHVKKLGEVNRPTKTTDT